MTTAAETCMSKLYDRIEALTPLDLPTTRFTRFSSIVPIEESEGPIRAFIIKESDLSLSDGVAAAKAGVTSCWFSLKFTISIFYPKSFMWDGDSALRNVHRLRLQDAIKIIVNLVFGAPLDSLDVDTYAIAYIDLESGINTLDLNFELRFQETIEIQ